MAVFPPVPVSTFANLRYGKALQEGFRRPGLVPVYGTNGQCGWHDTALAQPPGVILGRKGQGHLGVEWCERPFWVIDTAYFADIDTTKVDPRWFFFITRYVGLDDLKTGEKPGLQREAFLSQIFPLPPLPEQRAIAEVLGALDDKVELNRQMNHTLEEMASALFKSWFVDFEPVIAKAEGRRPFGMDVATADLFPQTFDGLLPLGWVNREGSSWFTIDKGISYKGEYLTELGKPMINLGCFLGKGRFRGERIKGYAGEYRTRHVVRPGDIVMANTDMTQERLILGSPCIVPDVGDVPEFLFSHHVFALRLLPGSETAREFLVQVLQLDAFRERAEGFANGTTVLGMPADAVLGAELLDPGPSLIAAFDAHAGMWRRLAEANSREARTLTALRDALIPKLLSGEVRVKQAEKLVEAAL